MIDEIRKKYQRDNEDDLRGTNINAINKLIEMLELHKKSKDENISIIAENFENIDEFAPNFTIFEVKEANKSMFMHNFKAFQISQEADMLVMSHEFGHAVLSIMNDTKLPQNYLEVITRAKQHALNTENKEYFKQYIQYLSGKDGKSEERTDAEKGPVSDIISSIFQLQALKIGSEDNICIFPSSHRREYYYDEKENKLNLKNIFDEDFANYYALKSNNCEKEIEIIRKLFGDELIDVLDIEIEKASQKIKSKEKENESESENKQESQIDIIKRLVISSKQSDIGVRIDIWTHLMRGCIIDYVH